jgi:ATP-dependent helicase STH1/SNF2
MQLQKHPFLFENVEDMVSPSGIVDEKIIRTTDKIALLHRILPKFFRWWSQSNFSVIATPSLV